MKTKKKLDKLEKVEGERRNVKKTKKNNKINKLINERQRKSGKLKRKQNDGTVPLRLPYDGTSREEQISRSPIYSVFQLFSLIIVRKLPLTKGITKVTY